MGYVEEGKMEIKSGLSPGDLVVTASARSFRDGDRVQYELPTTEPAPPPTSPSSATKPAASAEEAKRDRDLLRQAAKQLELAQKEYSMGLTDNLDVLKARRDLEVLHARVRGDTDAIPGIEFKYADEIYTLDLKKYQAGLLAKDELLQAEKDRIIAAAATQPSTAAPTTSPVDFQR
jgi:hypothetical protein